MKMRPFFLGGVSASAASILSVPMLGSERLEYRITLIGEASRDAGGTRESRRDQWPSCVGLVTSFFTTLIMSVHHHAILRNVSRTDAWLHFANGCLLLGVTFVPYPTSVLPSYLRTLAAKMAAVFYSATFVFMTICFYLFIRAAFRKPLALFPCIGGICRNVLPQLYVRTALLSGGSSRH
jgi:hypothetical protein